MSQQSKVGKEDVVAPLFPRLQESRKMKLLLFMQVSKRVLQMFFAIPIMSVLRVTYFNIVLEEENVYEVVVEVIKRLLCNMYYLYYQENHTFFLRDIEVP